MPPKYVYASNPKAVEKPKYKDEQSILSQNIMYDSRIRRGPTIGIPTVASENDLEVTNSKLENTTTKYIKKPQKYAGLQDILNNAHSTKVQSEQVPVHLYLEEQVEPIQISNIDAQTDEFLESPSKKKYIRPKVGVDVRIQVDSKLVFNFDRDIMVLVDNIVSKTLEQSLVEVIEESQLSNIRNRKEKVIKSRKIEGEKIKKVEYEEVALKFQNEEKDFLISQQEFAIKNVVDKVTATTLARQYLYILPRDVFAFLNKFDHFQDPVEQEIRETFMPVLSNEISIIKNNEIISRELTNSLLNNCMENLLKIENDLIEKMPYRLYIHWKHSKGVTAPVGPVEVDYLATIKDVHTEIIHHLTQPWISNLRPDLKELIDAAQSELKQLSDKKIKFMIGNEEVSGSLKELSTSGKLQKVEMRIDIIQQAQSPTEVVL